MPEDVVKCECELCCDGEHSGNCINCAGIEEAMEGCDYCGETGICPKCKGARGPDYKPEQTATQT